MIEVSNKSLKGLETIIKARKKYKTNESEIRETNKVYISIGEEVTFSVINQPMNMVISTSDKHSSEHQCYIMKIEDIKDLKVNKSLTAEIDTYEMEMVLSNGERIEIYELSGDLLNSTNRGIESIFNREFSYQSTLSIDELKSLETRWDSHIRFLDGKITDYCPYIARTPAYTMNESTISLDKTMPEFYMYYKLFDWIIKAFKGEVDIEFDLDSAIPVCHITGDIHAVIMLKKEI